MMSDHKASPLSNPLSMDMRKYQNIDELPQEIPLFLLRGAVLLPKALLPLPIFSSEHVSLIGECLQKNLPFGLIQPNTSIHDQPDCEGMNLFSTGCLARIVDLNEQKESRLIVTLEGICRFKLDEQIDNDNPYPTARVSYGAFVRDLVDASDFSMDRRRLITALKPYFDRYEIIPNWEEINQISNERLITALSMACPLRPSEKQYLLETESIQEQSEIITKLIEMASLSSHNDIVTYH